MAVYPNGGKFCFSCHYYERGEARLPVRNDDNPFIATVRPVGTRNLDEWPITHKTWLRQFLSDQEIKGHFEYVPSMQRHLFLHDMGDEGWFYDGRSMLPNVPKNIQCGPKPYLPFWQGQDETHTLVIVEDIVSAIKVNRVFNSMPLFGSYCRPSWVANLLADKYYHKFVVWLDSDKTEQAIELSRKLGVSRPSYVLSTEMDPKWYSDSEIQELVSQTYLTLTLDPT